MYYFFDKNFSEAEKKYAMNIKKYIRYLQEYDVFVDHEDKLVDIKGKKVIPVTSEDRLEIITDLITLNQGNPINTIENIQTIRNWSSYVEPNHFVKSFRLSELNDSFMCYLIENLGLNNLVCFKNLSSGFEIKITLSELLNENSALRRTMDIYNNDTYSIEEIINVSSKKQYRCFILGRKIINVSKKNSENYHRVEAKVIEEAMRIARSISFDFPNTFVLDLALIDKKVELINIEPFETAKRYLYNSIFQTNEKDIEVTKENRLPKEIRPNSFEYLESETEEIKEDYFAKTYKEFIECLKQNSDNIKLKYGL